MSESTPGIAETKPTPGGSPSRARADPTSPKSADRFSGGLQSRFTAILAGILSLVGIGIGMGGLQFGWEVLPKIFPSDRDQGLAIVQGLMAIVVVPIVLVSVAALVGGLIGLALAIRAYKRIQTTLDRAPEDERIWLPFKLWISLFWWLFLGWPIAFFAFAIFLDTINASAAWNALLWLALLLAFLVSSWKVAFLPCPRCTHRFFLATKNWSAFYRRCRHCDLRKYEAFESSLNSAFKSGRSG